MDSITSHWLVWKVKGCETGPALYSPYLRKLESLTLWECNYKGSTFSSVFKGPECWPGRSQTHDLPHGSQMLKQLSHRCLVECFESRLLLLIHVIMIVYDVCKKPWRNWQNDGEACDTVIIAWRLPESSKVFMRVQRVRREGFPTKSCSDLSETRHQL